MISDRFNSILGTANKIADKFKEHNKDLYLVGGSVRDILIDSEKPLYDLDYTTNARPGEISKILSELTNSLWKQGIEFGTVGCLFEGFRHEITTFRQEAYIPESRKPAVIFGESLEVDLSRRDFTINTIALDLSNMEIIDPYNGRSDLERAVLKTPLSPEISFSDDPLRMLRAARFISSHNVVPVEELVNAVQMLNDRINVVSKERIREELDKLLTTENPSNGLWFIVYNGLSAHFLPELDALKLEQDPIHKHKDVLAHTIAVVSKTSPNKITRLSALFHDIGKPKTRSFSPQGVSFHHHDVVGAKMTRKRMAALRYSKEDIEKVSKLVFLHLRFHTYRFGWTDKAVRRYAKDAGDLLLELNELTRCDCTTQNENKARELAQRMDELERRLDELAEKEELSKLRPELDGEEVMEVLDLKPSKQVGVALDWLMELRLDEGLLGSDEVKHRLVEWWNKEQHS